MHIGLQQPDEAVLLSVEIIKASVSGYKMKLSEQSELMKDLRVEIAFQLQRAEEDAMFAAVRQVNKTPDKLAVK